MDTAKAAAFPLPVFLHLHECGDKMFCDVEIDQNGCQIAECRDERSACDGRIKAKAIHQYRNQATGQIRHRDGNQHGNTDDPTQNEVLFPNTDDKRNRYTSNQPGDQTGRQLG